MTNKKGDKTRDKGDKADTMTNKKRDKSRNATRPAKKGGHHH